MSFRFNPRSPALAPEGKFEAFRHYPQQRSASSTGSQRPIFGQPHAYDGQSETDADEYPPIKEISEYPATKRRFGFWYYWWLETACCLLVLGAFAGVVAVLWTSDGKTLPQFPLNISINTMVAVLTAILKSAMILVIAEGLSHLKWAWFRQARPLGDISEYDMASRGPLGSIRLLLTLRGRDFIATIGAILTIAALAIDPFAQAVVQHYSCSTINGTASASVPRTNMYFEHGAHIGAGLSTIPQGIAAAVNGAIYANLTGAVLFDCPSGSCNFTQSYSTLGFCHLCNDTTPKLTLKSNGTVSANNFVSNYTLPSGMDSVSEEIPNNYFTTLFSMGPGNETASFGPSVDMIFTPGASSEEAGPLLPGAPSDAQCSQSKNQTFGCNNVGAASCSLFPCVRTYEATVNGGNLTENLVSTSAEFGSGQDTLTMVDVDCLSAGDKRNISEAGVTIAPGQKWLPYNISMSSAGTGWTTGLDDNTTTTSSSNASTVKGIVSEACIYEFGEISLNSFDLWAGTFFNGSAIQVDNAPNDNGIPYLLYTSLLNNVSFGTIDSVWSNIADSLTGYIRQHGDNSVSAVATKAAVGDVMQSQTCVSVRWYFLIFPGSMVLLTLFFFVAMIARTHREQRLAQDWKSNPLALLYHGLDGATLDRQLHGETENVSAMATHAKDLRVQLSMTSRGWKLVSAE